MTAHSYLYPKFVPNGDATFESGYDYVVCIKLCVRN